MGMRGQAWNDSRSQMEMMCKCQATYKGRIKVSKMSSFKRGRRNLAWWVNFDIPGPDPFPFSSSTSEDSRETSMVGIELPAACSA